MCVFHIAFYNTQGGTPYNGSNYSFDPGYFVGIGIDDVGIDDLPLRLTVGIEFYSGSAQARSGGLGGGQSTTVETNKALASLGILANKLTLYKRLSIEPGFLFSYLLHEKFSGSTTTSAGNAPTTEDLNDKTDTFNSSLYLGIQTRLVYDFKRTKTKNIALFYSFYLGLTNEFKMFPKATKSMRHQIGIGYYL